MTTTVIRMLLGACTLLLMGVIFNGCSGSDSTSATQHSNDTISAELLMPAPHAPTSGELANADIKPAAGQEVATLDPFTFTVDSGESITLGGIAPSMQINFAADSSIEGFADLYTNANNSAITTHQGIILPSGDTKLSFYHDSFIRVSRGSGAASYIKINRLDVIFSVHQGTPTPTWTLPNSIQLDMQLTNNKPNINGSTVRLSWDNSLGSVPPIDAEANTTAWVNTDFFTDATLTTRTVKIAPITNRTALITGTTPISFNGLGVTLDVRDGHTTTLSVNN